MRYRCVAKAAAALLMNFTIATAAVNNVQPVVVDYGPSKAGHLYPYPNALFTTVTVCVPGTTTCQSIDHVLIDTGSVGLRILSTQLTIALPNSKDAKNNSIGNCVQYADFTYQWGPIANADVKMAGEVASSIPIQIVGAANFPNPPFDCNFGGFLFPLQDVSQLGANGILGVGLFRQDCRDLCSRDTPIPAYWSCGASVCTIASTALSAQLQNPVWMFPQDNNGLSIVLPQVVATGSPSVTGSMIFGIGTQSNNALNGAVAMATDRSGTFTTTFKGKDYSGSFIDSGSNGLYFLDSSSTGLPGCTGIFTGFYCPQAPVNFTAVNTGPNPNGSGVPVSANIGFSVANGGFLLSTVLPNGTNVPQTAFNNLGGGGFFPAFDWGLPFFFGRTVFVGIEGQSSAAGMGPYVATITPDCTVQVNAGGDVHASGEAFPAAGGSLTFVITAPPGCEWTATTSQGIIASGIGNGAFAFTVGGNGGGDSTKTVTVEGQTFTIEQESATLVGASFIGSMPHLAAEENWTTMFTLVNKGAAQAQARVSFFPTIFDSSFDGTLLLPVTFPQHPSASAPVATPAVGPLLASTFDRTLAANASLIFNTAGPQTPPVLLGSARLTAIGAVDGFAIFHHIQTQQEAVVPLETRNANSYLLAFDNTGGAVLGVAVANLTAQDIAIPVVVRDDAGTVISAPGANVLVRANYQTSFVLSDQAQGFPVTAEKRGTIEFDRPAGARISVLGLRFTPPNNALTTIPALANVGTGGGSIAHLASGGDGWQTTFVLVNTGASAVPATLSFYADQTGAPLSLPLSFPQSGAGATTQATSYTQTLAAGASLVIVSDGAPQLLTGSAQLSSTGNVSGFVIFRHNGQEAVVPLESRNANAYIIAFDNTSGTATGIALNAVSAGQVNIPVTVRDDTGATIATDTITLAANGHYAFTLGTDKYPGAATIRGTIEFDKPAGAQIGALGIRIPAVAAHTYTTLPGLAK
jgi:hypothetical protein